MNQLDRRHILKSLAGGAAFVGVPCSVANAVQSASPHALAEDDERMSRVYLIARQPNSEPSETAINFWSMPWTEIPYAKHLPPQIARNAIWDDIFDARRGQAEALARFDRDYCDAFCAGIEGPREFVGHFDGIETLPATFASLIGDSKSERRIALVALDSMGPWAGWDHILPALSHCYDTVIGLYYLDQRGLRHQRASVSKEVFAETFLNPARFCDAVIVTSPALVEANVRSFPQASTEELVGRLGRHLGCALLTPAVLERIAGPKQNRTQRKPRFFALAGLALETDNDYFYHYGPVIDRQAALVDGSFGERVRSDDSLIVLTAVENPDSYPIPDLREGNPGSFLTAAVLAATFDKHWVGLNSARMITLWPFQLDHETRSVETTT